MCAAPAPAPAADWIKHLPQAGKIERIEAYFRGHGYDPHRHDTYAIGHTLSGVQSFRYRGAMRHSLPGGTLVLHPDEMHDGHAGTDVGFRYRMIYVEPALLQSALGGKPLPFIEHAISHDPRLFAATRRLLQEDSDHRDALARDDALFDLANALQAAAGARRSRHVADFPAAERARQYLHDMFGNGGGVGITLDALAEAAGRDRWQLCRDFRVLYGTSPYRYLTQRRLELARNLMSSGTRILDAALLAGFADQSHMTRHFKQSYGLPPGRWSDMLGNQAALR